MIEDDRFGLMTAFVRVAERRSFAAAAKDLAITPSSLSRRIVRLEARFGVRLLERSTRRVALSEAGRRFHDDCLRILNELAEAEARVTAHAATPTGTLRLSAPVSFGRLHLGPVLPCFLAAHPTLRVDFTMTDRFIDLIGEGIDVAIRIGDLSDSRLVARRLMPNRRLLCASPRYLDHHGSPRFPRDLMDHSCLNFSMLHSGDTWHLDGPNGRESVAVSGALRADNAEVLREAAVAGCGIALLATFIVGDDLAAGRLVPVLDDWRVPEAGVFVVYPHARYLPPKVRVFVNFVVERFGPEPPWDAA